MSKTGVFWINNQEIFHINLFENTTIQFYRYHIDRFQKKVQNDFSPIIFLAIL